MFYFVVCFVNEMPSLRKKSCNKIAVKSNPELWKKIVHKVKMSPKGGKVGKWSARKSQLAVKMYKQSGGKYSGRKSSCNSLTKWTKEKWDYVKGSSPAKHKGRYLPLKVRQSLTKKEIKEENKRKGSKRGKWISYSPSVAKKMHKYKIV